MVFFINAPNQLHLRPEKKIRGNPASTHLPCDLEDSGALELPN